MPDEGGSGDPADELVDLAEADGRIVGRVTRREMRAGGLPHRSTFVVQVLVDPDEDATDRIDDDHIHHWIDAVIWRDRPVFYDGPGSAFGELRSVGDDTLVVVHRRADWKDVNPGEWDLAFGGVCGAGEPWLVSARRELREEAGLIDVPVMPAGAGRHVDQRGTVFGALFVAPSRTWPEPVDGEVVALDEVAIGDLPAWCRGRPVCGDSKALILPLLDRLVAGQTRR